MVAKSGALIATTTSCEAKFYAFARQRVVNQVIGI
jgi:hypothetical protein